MKVFSALWFAPFVDAPPFQEVETKRHITTPNVSKQL